MWGGLKDNSNKLCTKLDWFQLFSFDKMYKEDTIHMGILSSIFKQQHEGQSDLLYLLCGALT